MAATGLLVGEGDLSVIVPCGPFTVPLLQRATCIRQAQCLSASAVCLPAPPARGSNSSTTWQEGLRPEHQQAEEQQDDKQARALWHSAEAGVTTRQGQLGN